MKVVHKTTDEWLDDVEAKLVQTIYRNPPDHTEIKELMRLARLGQRIEGQGILRLKEDLNAVLGRTRLALTYVEALQRGATVRYEGGGEA